ncbi:hypothetical protein B0H13DRAFT_2452607 [Mycena leptocephala]|nr:hypothetical protein B0H13DRAFT_2452607 [Mycena leptocephala]
MAKHASRGLPSMIGTAVTLSKSVFLSWSTITMALTPAAQLVATAITAIKSNSNRHYPVQLLQKVNKVADRDPILRGLLNVDGKKEAKRVLVLELLGRLPIHLQTPDIMEDVSDAIIETLTGGDGFEIGGDKIPGLFPMAIAVMVTDYDPDFSAKFLGSRLQDVLVAIEDRANKITFLNLQKKKKKTNIRLQDRRLEPAKNHRPHRSDTYDMNPNEIICRVREDLSLQIQHTPILPLPHLSPESWPQPECTAPDARLVYLGRVHIEALLSPVITLALKGQKEAATVANQQFINNALTDTTVLRALLAQIKKYADTTVSPFPGAVGEDVESFLFEYVGRLITGREFGLRNLRPWLVETFKPLAKRVVRTITSRRVTNPRKRPATKESNTKAKRAKVSLGREILPALSTPAVLRDRTNLNIDDTPIPSSASAKPLLPLSPPRPTAAPGSSRTCAIILSP